MLRPVNLKVGDKFITVRSNGAGFAIGTIITLHHDDGSTAPLFTGKNHTFKNAKVDGRYVDGAYIHFDNLEPYTEDNNNKEKVMLTASDVPVGTVYKFHEEAFKERPHLYKGLYVKNTYNSSIMKCNGATIPFRGHQLLPIVIVAEEVEYKESKPTSKVNVIRQRLTISDIEVGETFIVHGKPEVVYVKISNSHCFNLSAMQMHTTTAERFKDLLNIVKVNMVILNGK